MPRPANRLRTLSVFIAARREALRYAMQNYGHFEEVQLEPYPPDLSG
jgi:hypothetical protein